MCIRDRYWMYPSNPEFELLSFACYFLKSCMIGKLLKIFFASENLLNNCSQFVLVINYPTRQIRNLDELINLKKWRGRGGWKHACHQWFFELQTSRGNCTLFVQTAWEKFRVCTAALSKQVWAACKEMKTTKEWLQSFLIHIRYRVNIRNPSTSVYKGP